MNLTDSITLKCLAGSPIFIGEAACAIYPPTLREVASVGYDKFLQYIQILTMTKPVSDVQQGLKELIAPLNDFQYLILMSQIDGSIMSILKEAFQFFTHENLSISLEKELLFVGNLDDKRFLDFKLYQDFKQVVKRVCWVNMGEEEIAISDDDDEHTRALKQRMLENREKLARAKAKQSQTDKSSDIEFSDLVASVAAGECGLNIHNIWDITYYAFHDQLKRMGWREQFDINNRAAMAGAKIKKADLRHWIKGMSSNNK